MESSRSRRLRLAVGDESVFWARIDDGYYGVWALRPSCAPRVVRPIRAAEARAIGDVDAWMRWFARQLDESDASPLAAGRWNLTELAPQRAHASADVLFPQTESAEGLPAPAYGLRAALDRPPVDYEDWGGNGSAGVLPMRERSPAEAGRVKAWVKHAREGTLPPLLLWWVCALDAHLILDGHDRLAAAQHVGVTPRVVTLWQSLDTPVPLDPRALAHFVRSYEELFDNPDVGLAARRRLNATLLAKHRDTWRRAITTAKANPGLDRRWAEEVRARAPMDHEDTLGMLGAGRTPALD